MSATVKDWAAVVAAMLFEKDSEATRAALADLFAEQGMEDEARKLRHSIFECWVMEADDQSFLESQVTVHGEDIVEVAGDYCYTFHTEAERTAFLSGFGTAEEYTDGHMVSYKDEDDLRSHFEE